MVTDGTWPLWLIDSGMVLTSRRVTALRGTRLPLLDVMWSVFSALGLR